MASSSAAAAAAASPLSPDESPYSADVIAKYGVGVCMGEAAITSGKGGVEKYLLWSGGAGNCILIGAYSPSSCQGFIVHATDETVEDLSQTVGKDITRYLGSDFILVFASSYVMPIEPDSTTRAMIHKRYSNTEKYSDPAQREELLAAALRPRYTPTMEKVSSWANSIGRVPVQEASTKLLLDCKTGIFYTKFTPPTISRKPHIPSYDLIYCDPSVTKPNITRPRFFDFPPPRTPVPGSPKPPTTSKQWAKDI